MPLSRTLLLLALSLSLAAFAQQATAPLPAFDVVAIHENKSADMSSSVRWGKGDYVATNATLSSLLMAAYGIRDDQMSGLPGWATSLHFDINAKISDPDPDVLKKLSRDQLRAMMVALLNDRFHLRAHIEVKTLPVYDLVIAKGGSKLKENTTPFSDNTDPGKTPSALKAGSFMLSNSSITGIAIPISTLTNALGYWVERNIIDKTGLTSRYDINLKWTPTELEGKTDDNTPGLFTAIQEQLGLKLESSKGPVDTLVVDHVEMPTEN